VDTIEQAIHGRDRTRTGRHYQINRMNEKQLTKFFNAKVTCRQCGAIGAVEPSLPRTLRSRPHQWNKGQGADATETDEIAEMIIKAFGSKPKTEDEARLLTTGFMGKPTEVERQVHANVIEALLRTDVNRIDWTSPVLSKFMFRWIDSQDIQLTVEHVDRTVDPYLAGVWKGAKSVHSGLYCPLPA
jgi:creatinine amidohydrolase/Fe(II)-dependent formamide hydrolase-like protein